MHKRDRVKGTQIEVVKSKYGTDQEKRNPKHFFFGGINMATAVAKGEYLYLTWNGYYLNMYDFQNEVLGPF